jgi:hypothetical protein
MLASAPASSSSRAISIAPFSIENSARLSR